MNELKVSIEFNQEKVYINYYYYELKYKTKNGKYSIHQYSTLQEMYSDMFGILLHHLIGEHDYVDYGTNNHFSIYKYNGKTYRIWFYCDGQLYIQHIDEYYESVDDMIGDYTPSIIDILNAIINDNK